MYNESAFSSKSFFQKQRESSTSIPFAKDTFYRFMNSSSINWRKFTLQLSSVVIQKIEPLTNEKRCNTKSRRGKYRLGIRTSKKKLKSKRQMFKAWLRTRLIKPVNETMRLLSLAFRGHCNYYGISGNSKDVSSFHDYMKTRTYLMLKLRSQRTRITREKFNRIWKYYIMSPRIVVDIWSRRLFEELNAGKPHVQFCEGRM